jgi:hypothetical protein
MGKAISRLNARKHGIFASALTPEDSEELFGIEDELAASLRPVGRVEQMLVEKLALTYLRMQRCARAEAEYHSQTWEGPNPVLNPYAAESLQERRDCGARASTFDAEAFERMVKLMDLYDARLTSQFLKLIHEIERLQRLRTDADAPWPLAAEVTVQTDTGAAGSAPATASEAAPEAAPDGATTTSTQATATLPPAPPVVADQNAGIAAQTPSGVPNCLPASSPEHTREELQPVGAVGNSAQGVA